MKIPKEYSLIAIVGLFLLAYLLDSVVDPLNIQLVTPYHFLQSQYMSLYPFSTASVIIKSVALFWAPLWILSFIKDHFIGKASTLLVLASLMQLYALQEIATNARLIPMEWSLSLSLSGLALLIPAVLTLIRGMFAGMRKNVSEAKMEETIKRAQVEAE